MKRSFIIICGCIFLLASCKEKGPVINFGNVVVADTTYVVPVPAAEPHNVFAEDFTGQSCPNCPAAHDILSALSSAHAGRLNVLALYIFNVAQAVPPADALYDLRDTFATDIGTSIYSGAPQSGIPCGGIDRVPVGGNLSLYASGWSDAFNQRLNAADSLNLAVTSGYNAVDSIDTVVATITYITQVATPQTLYIAVVEDSIIDLQDTPSGVVSGYVFNNVFRGFVTPSSGDAILSAMAVKEPGRVDRRTYLYKLKSGRKPANCRLVAFVTYSSSFGSKAVLQSVQTKMN